MTSEEVELKSLHRKINNVRLTLALPVLLMGVAIFSIFGTTDGKALHPLLENNNILVSIFMVGIAAPIWGFIKTRSMFKRIDEIENNKQS